MWCLLLCVLLLINALQPAVVERPGVCFVVKNETRVRYVVDTARGSWRRQEYYVPVSKEACCEGYQPRSYNPLKCLPKCDPECENADCTAPDTCVCKSNHILVNNSTSSCYDVCESCQNGYCEKDALECTCNENYERDEILPHVCEPICLPSCQNGFCMKPNKCECLDGFTKHVDNDNVCVPVCSRGCVLGTCTSPEDCTCMDGFMNDQDSPHVCVPICSPTCENGVCTAGNTCTCKAGFEHHPRNHFQCLSRAQANSLHFCEFNMDKAITFHEEGHCIELNDRIIVRGSPGCQPLRVLSTPSCSQPNSCSLPECVLKLRCSAKIVNKSNEIHCDLFTDRFEVTTTNIYNYTIAEWLNATLVVNSYQDLDPSTVDTEASWVHIQDWVVSPVTTKAICGQNNFGMQICRNDDDYQHSASSNVSFLRLMNIFLVLSFLLLVVAGLSGFLWVRHRRLNNPLNYRESLGRGWFVNECYESQPAVELVQDMESDHEDA